MLSNITTTEHDFQYDSYIESFTDGDIVYHLHQYKCKCGKKFLIAQKQRSQAEDKDKRKRRRRKGKICRNEIK